MSRLMSQTRRTELPRCPSKSAKDMDCTGELPLKTTEVVSKLIRSKKYHNAWQLLQKAGKVFPKLDNLHGMKIVCSTLWHANEKMPDEIDWYNILWLLPNASDAAIRTQHQIFANCLKPIEDTFPGTKSALKLIDNAITILGDQPKRSEFDERRAALEAASYFELQEIVELYDTGKCDSGLNCTNSPTLISNEICDEKDCSSGLYELQRERLTESGDVDQSMPQESLSKTAQMNCNCTEAERPDEKAAKRTQPKRKGGSCGDDGVGDGSLHPKRVASCTSEDGLDILASSVMLENYSQGQESLGPLVRDQNEEYHVLDQNLSLTQEYRALRSRVFKALPQEPHFQPLSKLGSEVRKGIIVGLDMAFVALSEKIRHLNLKTFWTGLGSINEQLVQLEGMGYNVEKLREHLNSLQGIVRRGQTSIEEVVKLETEIKDGEVEIKIAEDKALALQSQVTSLEVELERLKREVNSKQSKIDDLRFKAITLTEGLSKLESEFESVALTLW